GVGSVVASPGAGSSAMPAGVGCTGALVSAVGATSTACVGGTAAGSTGVTMISGVGVKVGGGVLVGTGGCGSFLGPQAASSIANSTTTKDTVFRMRIVETLGL